MRRKVHGTHEDNPMCLYHTERAVLTRTRSNAIHGCQGLLRWPAKTNFVAGHLRGRTTCENAAELLLLILPETEVKTTVLPSAC